MRGLKALWGVGLAACVAILMMAGSASAVTTTAVVCVPEKSSQPVLSPDNEGTCLKNSSTKYKEIVIGKPGPEGKQGKEGLPGKEGAAGKEGKEGPAGKEGKEGAPGKEGKEGPAGKEGKEGKAGTSLLSESEQTTLKEVLPCIKYVAVGVGGKPTVQISGCNLQILNGEGKTNTTNGAGNLVIGYDELQGGCPPEVCPIAPQTGSHNLIVGQKQSFTSFGGIVAGENNTITGQFASVTGGDSNKASAFGSSVSGGDANTASANFASVTGGDSNTASEFAAAVTGGAEDAASGHESSVSGGHQNEATGQRAWVGGGQGNIAEGLGSSVFGGKELMAKNEYEAIP